MGFSPSSFAKAFSLPDFEVLSEEYVNSINPHVCNSGIQIRKDESKVLIQVENIYVGGLNCWLEGSYDRSTGISSFEVFKNNEANEAICQVAFPGFPTSIYLDDNKRLVCVGANLANEEEYYKVIGGARVDYLMGRQVNQGFDVYSNAPEKVNHGYDFARASKLYIFNY